LAAPAAAQTASAEPTAEQVKAFLKHQGDPVVGAWVERQLQQGNGAAIAAASAPDETRQQETAQDEVADYLDARLKVIGSHIADSARPCRCCQPRLQPRQGG
jgi:hypothetical protein